MHMIRPKHLRIDRHHLKLAVVDIHHTIHYFRTRRFQTASGNHLEDQLTVFTQIEPKGDTVAVIDAAYDPPCLAEPGIEHLAQHKESKAVECLGTRLKPALPDEDSVMQQTTIKGWRQAMFGYHGETFPPAYPALPAAG